MEPFLVDNLTTERLRLRDFTPNDTLHIHCLESLPEIVQYQLYEPMTAADAAKYVERALDSLHANPRAVLELIVELKDSQQFIGRVGMSISHEKLHGDLWFSFLPAAQGHGYAAEAVQGLLSLVPKLNSLGIECDPKNAGCRKLATRLGFKEVRSVEKMFKSKGQWVGSVEYEKRLEH
ncbi:acetyltransferase [Colletotrichum graminicola M1.001]|uniref:Acetyltransferase n=1 Tax=Colletotrichum graminicola (strain M1.001 / M2 / FGSC 10212) TaxID=645133 RepID=E3QZS0_COLGM|nr:acetyltransferase [Colletotrichum graminicola M1.001]EFQ36358.1 acetyltransferase [Colletotrichum graminicola M1.001]